MIGIRVRKFMSPVFSTSSIFVVLPIIPLAALLVIFFSSYSVLVTTPSSSSSSSSSSSPTSELWRIIGNNSSSAATTANLSTQLAPAETPLISFPKPDFRNLSSTPEAASQIGEETHNKSATQNSRSRDVAKIRLSSSLHKLEARLVEVRASIREAALIARNFTPDSHDSLPDPDFTPKGHIYRNPNAFHRSYLEMEKLMKIYVYEEGEPPVFHDGPCRSIYSSEGRFIHEIEKGGLFRTRDPNKALVYFLPFSVVNMVRYLFEPDSHDTKPMRRVVVDYMNLIAHKHPFWNRSLGADHFMLSCHDWIDRIFKDEASEEKGERARMASFIGAMAIADLVKTTLGPKGMDKILQSTGRGHEVTVTNDGATILKSLHIDNPAAKVLVDISKVQDDEVGDGTTSVVVLAGELLREAEKLVNARIHPMTIISGFRMAAECARKALLEKVVDNKTDSEKFKSDLMKIARTTLSSKILSQDKEHFAKLAVDAVLRLKGSTNLEAILIIKKPGGSLKDSFLDEGFILDKKIGIGQPKRIENAKILVTNTAMDTDKVKIYGARVRVDSMSKVAEIEGAEKEKMREKVQKIIGHDINCFVNRQLIYNFPEELFADAGILAIEHADFDGIERLALVTGGEIASTFDNPESVKLGHCKLIEEIMIGEDKLIHFSGVEMGQACTIVLRGASHHVLDEADRSLHDALCVLSQTVNDSRVLLGGGWPEMIMAKEVDELAKKTPGKKSHAIEAFSRALLAIPTIIADNAGLESAELIAQLRAEHQKEGCTAGIDVITGSVGDMAELGISEAFKVKQAVLLSATEAAEMILRVDEIITCAPRRREDRM